MAQSPSKLPIHSALPTIGQQWSSGQRWVIEAAPGAGKSTELPRYLLEHHSGAGKILLVQPRRAAAKTVAQRIAEQLGESLGQRVGYQVAKSQQVSADTKLIVMTSGVLLQYLASDPTLEEVDTVLLDEFHERSWQLDALYALCLQLSWLRDDFRLLVLSATLPGEKIAQAMDAHLLQVPGRQFPVEIQYQPAEPNQISQTVTALLAKHQQATLVFLPGRRWIEELATLIQDRPVYRLHSGLELNEQQATIAAQEPNRVVLATNIAETSVTLPGIGLVIDSGLAREPEIDRTSGLTKLITRRISRASADQRSGRAGRTQAGQAIRLWPSDEALVAQPRPDIEQQPLFELYLMLEKMAESPEQLPWLSPPGHLAWQKARQQARAWHWIDDSGLTEQGQQAIALATQPLIAKLVLSQPNNPEVLTLAAQLHCHGDRLDHSIGRSNECQQQLGRWRALGYRSAQVKSDLGDLLAPAFSHLLVPPNANRTLAGQSVQDARPHWRLIWQATPRGTRLIERSSYGVSQSIAEQVLSSQQQVDIGYHWQGNKPRKVATTRVHSYDIDQRPLPLSANDWQNAIIDKLNTDGIESLLTSTASEQWWQKYRYLHQTSDLVEEFSWLADYLAGVTEFNPASLWQLVKFQLDPNNELDKTLPDYWVTPAGSKAKIDYSGEQPNAKIKLQACFGLTQQPMLGGKALQIHLCSPSGQPVAQTTDIKFFWLEVYPQVRKELRGRYNKHPWPEDPMSSTATLQTNRQLRQ